MKTLYQHIIFTLLSVLMLSNYYIQGHTDSNRPLAQISQTDNSNKPEVWLTIFIHGIMSIQPHLTLENFFRFYADDVRNTPYERAVYYIRQDKFFYKNQMMQKFGLHEIDIHDIKKDNATSALANVYEQVNNLVQPERENHYYTFGWSGLLSKSERYFEAEHLYQQLIDVILEFIKKGIEPKIRLIGYSHGVNLALNMAAIRRDKYPENNILSIDELILIGGPIQPETDYLINDEIFKKVYNCYSKKDRIQSIDFFSRGRLFSGKRFKNRLSFSVNPNIRQIQLDITRVRKTNECRFEQYLKRTKNLCAPGIISSENSLLRDMSPGHIELWFFSWSPRHYRSDFILEPYPLLIYLPYIIYQLEQNIDAFCLPQTIIADIRPEHEQIIFKQGHCNQTARVTPFVSNKMRRSFIQIADITRPDNYTEHEYNKHLHDAIDRAKADFCHPCSLQEHDF